MFYILNKENEVIEMLVIVLLFILVIWVGPIIAGTIIAKRKNRSPHWFWFGIWPGLGFWIFIIMLFLEPLAICEECNMKIPKYAKLCPYCSKETQMKSKNSEEIKKIKKQDNKFLAVALITVFILFICFGCCLFVSVSKSFKSCEPYEYSIKMIENNPEIMKYLGENYKQIGIVSGSISTNDDLTGKAEISYKLKGKNGISKVYVKAEKENGVWLYQKINFYKEKRNSNSINLLE